MKQILIILCLIWGTVQAQTIGYLRYDSVKIAKPGGNAELIIENATKAVTGGVLTNTGNGRSAWVAAGGIVVSDSAWSLTGNSGTTAGTNFVGTTDAVALWLNTNSVNRLIIPSTGIASSTDANDSVLVTKTDGVTLGKIAKSSLVGVTSLAAIGAVANANGATISGNTLNLQPASASFGGVVTTGTQTLAGNKVFSNFIGLNGTSVGGSSWITGSISSPGFQRISLTNTNVGAGASVGALYTNDGANELQYYMGSVANSYVPDAALIRSTGTNGIKLVTDGAGAKFRFGNTASPTGIESGVFMGMDGNELYHNAIPQASSTSAKTVLLYDTASGGYFSQISLDSIGGGGGSGTVNSGTQYRLGYYATTGTAISEAAAITANRALISDANGVPTHATTTATQLGYLSSATGTTGTASTNLVFSTSPALTTPTVATSITPASNDGAAIGTTALQFSDLFLAEGGVINWDNGDATLTQAGNTLTLAGADLYTTAVTGSTASLADAIGLTLNSTSFAGAANKGRINMGTAFSFSEYYGSLGIGVLNSTVPLHVKSSGTTYNGLKIENTTNSSYARQDWVNNVGDLTQMLLAGSTYSSGIFTSNSASFFNNGAGGTNIGASNAAGVIRFFTAGTGTADEKMRVTTIGNILIGGTADPTSAAASLGIYNGTAPSASITNGTILYSEDVAASSELKVRDEAGNITVLSPHNFSQLGKPSEDLAWSYYSEKDGKYITVDMAKAIRTIEDLSARVEKLEKELGIKSTPPVKLLYKGKVKKK